MVAMYTIAGRQVGSHVLAITTLATTFGVSAYFMRGDPKKKAEGPPIQASSKEEEQFIQDFIKAANAESQGAKH